MTFSTTKKNIVWITTLLLIGVIIILFICKQLKKQKIPNETLMRDAARMEAFNADIIVVGNLADATVPINFRRSNKITEDVLSARGVDGYHILVLYDCDGALILGEEEIALIKKYCEELHFDMLYLGSAHMHEFHKYGLISYEPINEECFLYQGYQFRNGNPYKYNGTTWVNEVTGAFNSNPFILFEAATDFSGENLKPDSMWSEVFFMALYSLEN